MPNNTDIILIFPPGWIPFAPYTALPVISGFLKSNNINVIQKDLNVAAYDYFHSPEFILLLEEKCNNNLQNKPKGLEVYKKLKNISKLLPKLRSKIDRAKETFKSKMGFYDFAKYLKATDVLHKINYCINQLYFPLIYQHDKFFHIPNYDLSWGHFNEALSNPQKNILLDYYERKVIPELIEKAPLITGISVTCQSQIIPAFSLLKLLKEKHPETFTVIGGSFLNYIDYRADKLLLNLDFIDGIILYEGEIPLLSLINSKKGQSAINTVPNLVYRGKGGQIKRNNIISPLDINRMPAPSFDGIPLDLYLSPEPILPVIGSRGCYWGKCAFCNIPYGTKGCYKYEAKKPEKFVDELISLNQTYNCRHFDLCDEAVSPKWAERVCEILEEKNQKFTFKFLARFEKGFSSSLCRKMKKNGFNFVLFGLESANNRVLSKMNKGTNKDTIKSVLENFANAQILTHSSLLFNFPTETPEEALETIDFAFKNMQSLHSIEYNNFGISPNSYIFKNPEEFDIKGVQRFEGLFEDFTVMEHHKQNYTNDEFTEKILKEHPLEVFLRHFIYTNHRQLYLDYYGLSWFFEKSTEFNNSKIQTTEYATNCPIEKEIKENELFLKYLYIEEFSEGAQYFEELICRFPYSPNFYYYIAFFCYKMGEYEKSRFFLKQALLLDYGYKKANGLLGEIQKK